MSRFTCLALALCVSSPALARAGGQAEDALPSPEAIANHDMVTVGAGLAIVPDYEGSDDYEVIPVAAIRGKLGRFSFESRDTYFYLDVLPKSDKVDFDFGPIIGARFSSRHHLDDPYIRKLPNRRTAIEAGAFVGVDFHGLTNPYDTLGLQLDVFHDFGGAHKSTVFGPNIEFSTPLSRRTYVSFNGGMEFVSSKFANYYFSISPSDALASGLPAFKADGGLKNWKMGLLVDQSISGDLMHGLSIFWAAQFSRLVGSFKRSPIVSLRGRADQWIGAAGLAYTW